jgi:thiosulfate reductase cytochrome b subunit
MLYCCGSFFLSDGIELDTSKFTPLIHGTSTTCGKPRWYIALIMNFRMKIKKTSQTKLNSSQNISFFRYLFLLLFLFIALTFLIILNSLFLYFLSTFQSRMAIRFNHLLFTFIIICILFQVKHLDFQWKYM